MVGWVVLVFFSFRGFGMALVVVVVVWFAGGWNLEISATAWV